MQILDTYGQMQKISWRIEHLDGKEDTDVEDICLVMKNDRTVDDSAAPLNKNQGGDLNIVNGIVVLTIIHVDFGTGKLLPKTQYEVGMAIKYNGDDMWYKQQFSEDEESFFFEYPIIQK